MSEPKPFKSLAQIEKFKGFVAEGKMTQAHFDACMAITEADKLPDRLHPKKEKKPDFGSTEPGDFDSFKETKAGKNESKD